MRKTSVFLISVVAVTAGAQQPEMCPAVLSKQWEAKKLAVVKAKRGDKLYLPKPFPKTLEDFRADVRYSFFKNFYPVAKRAEEALKCHQELFQRLKDGTFELEVIPVTSWSGSACERKLYAVRVYRQAAPPGAPLTPERLLAIFGMHETGEVGSLSVVDPGAFPPELRQGLPSVRQRLEVFPGDPSTLEERVQQRFGVVAKALGYVQATWFAGHCPVFDPCVLLEGQGKRYLYSPHWDPNLETVFILEREPKLMTLRAFEQLGGPRGPDQGHRAFLRLREQTGYTQQVLFWGFDPEGNQLLNMVHVLEPSLTGLPPGP